MNIRDPFDLHRNSRSAAFSILRDRAVEAGTHALAKGIQAVEDMSFTVPRNVPSFSNPQRQLEDRAWGAWPPNNNAAASSGALGGLRGPDRNALPMYKDKPYAYAPSQRARPLYRRKRVLLALAALLMTVMWLFGGFWGDHGGGTPLTMPGFPWLQRDDKAKSKADWLGRRERVVEAFQMSWDAYERYAWGKNSSGQGVPLDAYAFARV